MTRKILFLIPALVVLGTACSDGNFREPRAFVGDDGCANETLPTFKVDGRAWKSRYRPGQTATVVVQVERSAEGFGLARSVEPKAHHGGVEDANVGIHVTMGNVRSAGLELTDETGQAVVRIPLPKDSPAGWATVGGRAWKDLVSEPCPVTEEGMLRGGRLFRIAATP